MRIRVVDVNGAMITTATVTLRGRGKRARRSAQTNAVGEVVWTDLPMGNCRIAVEAPGFSRRRLTAALRNSDEMKIEVVLEVAAMYEMAPIKSPSDASAPLAALFVACPPWRDLRNVSLEQE
jgi:hypothetical protein